MHRNYGRPVLCASNARLIDDGPKLNYDAPNNPVYTGRRRLAVSVCGVFPAKRARPAEIRGRSFIRSWNAPADEEKALARPGNP